MSVGILLVGVVAGLVSFLAALLLGVGTAAAVFGYVAGGMLAVVMMSTRAALRGNQDLC